MQDFPEGSRIFSNETIGGAMAGAKGCQGLPRVNEGRKMKTAGKSRPFG
jgi:hypothetical protein